MTKLYSILIPVTDFLPIKELAYGVYVASGNNTTIKLLGIESNETKEMLHKPLKKRPGL